MKLNQSTNLRVEDFPDQKEWVGRLFVILNAFMGSIEQIIDQNIDYTTNIKAVTKEYDSSSLTVPIKFSWPYPGFPPVELRIAKAMSGTTATVLMPAWEYNASTQEISITALYELSTTATTAIAVGTRYRFTVRVSV